MGGTLPKVDSPRPFHPETKLEAKILEAVMRRESKGSSLKSFNRVILKFPKIDESLRKCKDIFEEFDVDRNGLVDLHEMKLCFRKLDVDFIDEAIHDFFEECDINDVRGMKFNEFIVLLCLVYLLKDDPDAQHTTSRIGLPNLEATFETIVDAFVFLDENKDGHVSRTEMVHAINETTSGERSSGRIAMRRFEEMDWDKNGMVNFREFLFAFTRWVGIEDTEDDDDDDDDNGGEDDEDVNEN